MEHTGQLTSIKQEHKGDVIMNKDYTKVTITVHKGALKYLVPLLETLKQMGNLGCSRKIIIDTWKKEFYWDGDGQCRIKSIKAYGKPMPIKRLICWFKGHDYKNSGDYAMCWRCTKIKKTQENCSEPHKGQETASTKSSYPAVFCEGQKEYIKELEKLLRRYRNETPLGNQPHMIAHKVDALLTSAPKIKQNCDCGRTPLKNHQEGFPSECSWCKKPIGKV